MFTSICDTFKGLNVGHMKASGPSEGDYSASQEEIREMSLVH